jgi:hypothetical protein
MTIDQMVPRKGACYRNHVSRVVARVVVTTMGLVVLELPWDDTVSWPLAMFWDEWIHADAREMEAEGC